MADTWSPHLDYEVDRSGPEPIVRNLTTPIKRRRTFPGISRSEADEADGNFWTTLLRFIILSRTDAEENTLLKQLDNTTECPCNKPTDTGLRFPPLKEVVSLHYLREMGTTLYNTYFELGYFFPAKIHQPQNVNPHLPSMNSSSPPHSRGFFFRNVQTPLHLPPLHRKNRQKRISPGIAFMVCLIQLTAIVIDTRTSLSFSKGRSRVWPYSPRDFLLLIKDDTIRNSTLDGDYTEDIRECALILLHALERWSIRIPHLAPTMFLTATINMCGTLIIPAVIQVSYSICIVASIARFVVDASMISLRQIDEKEPSHSHFLARRDIGRWVLESFDAVATYYKTISFRDDIPFHWNAVMFGEFRFRLFQLFAMMMYLLEDTRIPKSLRTSERWVKVRNATEGLCGTFHTATTAMRSAPRHRLLCHPRVVTKIQNIMASDPVIPALLCPETVTGDEIEEGRKFALASVPILRYRTYCFAAACPQSIQAVGADFKACSGCGIAKYCCRACQKLDWRGLRSNDSPDVDKSRQHSEICKLLIRFRPYLMSQNKEWRDIQFTDDEWLRLRDWCKLLIPAGPPSTATIEILEALAKQLGETMEDTNLEELEEAEAEEMTTSENSGGMDSWDDFEDVIEEFITLTGAPRPIILDHY
ncbi:hypothetical protein CPB83DRAFT_864210 [Crepidotus variabilis]|uniref:MYND-type domain-containing protein n=1 Tax=Crepidotus variabilis TaxID=179855 RepID=A0A9P6E572_9AGAR|nr:hypothetical protein CPB83DRAFT_864210 [Crepidotus variabilis]